VAAPLYGDGQSPLMLGARPGLAPGIDPASLRDVWAQLLGIFVIDKFHLFTAKSADFALGNILRSLPLPLRSGRFGFVHSILPDYYSILFANFF
jgi:hypothetical protein